MTTAYSFTYFAMFELDGFGTERRQRKTVIESKSPFQALCDFNEFCPAAEFIRMEKVNTLPHAEPPRKRRAVLETVAELAGIFLTFPIIAVIFLFYI